MKCFSGSYGWKKGEGEGGGLGWEGTTLVLVLTLSVRSYSLQGVILGEATLGGKPRSEP